jgi:Flp pilus assembly protein TadD
MLRRAFGVFFACLGLAAVLGVGSSLLGVQDHFQRRLTIKSLEIALAQNPRDPKLHIILGVLQFEDGREEEGIGRLSAAATLAPRNPEALNGLAWLLATARRKDLRRPKLALKLALEAVSLSPRPHIWDTLAEAYFINGRPRKALAAERAALAAGPRRNQEHYQSQLERFQKAVKEAK